MAAAVSLGAPRDRDRGATRRVVAGDREAGIEHFGI
jgi:hypothetical protein